jgi:hypothetical protein
MSEFQDIISNKQEIGILVIAVESVITCRPINETSENIHVEIIRSRKPFPSSGYINIRKHNIVSWWILDEVEE